MFSGKSLRDGGFEAENDLGENTEGEEGKWDVSIEVGLAPGCAHTHAHTHTHTTHLSPCQGPRAPHVRALAWVHTWVKLSA